LKSGNCSDVDTHETMMKTVDERSSNHKNILGHKGSFVVSIPDEIAFQMNNQRNLTMKHTDQNEIR